MEIRWIGALKKVEIWWIGALKKVTLGLAVERKRQRIDLLGLAVERELSLRGARRGRARRKVMVEYS